MKKNKVFIQLMGREYALLTDQDVAQVQRLSRYVDRKMREVAITTRASDSAVAVLSSITLADELFRAQDENVRLRKELETLRAEQNQG